MNNRYDTKIVLGSSKNAETQDDDIIVQIPLESTSLEMIEGDRSVNLSLPDRFNEERQGMKKYRVYGKITPLLDNAYIGQATQTNSTLWRDLCYTDPTTGEFIRTGGVGMSVLQQAQYNTALFNNWVGYPPFLEFDIMRNDVDEAAATTTNWNTYISYVYSCDSDVPMAYQIYEGGPIINFVSGDGIPFYIINTTNNGRKVLRFYCPVEHGLKKGEYINITQIQGYSFPNGQTTFSVYSVGDGAFKSEKKVFDIVVPSIVNTTPNLGTGTVTDGSPPDQTMGIFKRQLNLTEPNSISKYYVHIHKIITTLADSVINRAGFENEVFQEKSSVITRAPSESSSTEFCRKCITNNSPAYLYSFTKDIDISKLIDNLGRPLSSLYVTVILRNSKGWFNYPPNKGWDWNFPMDFEDTTIQPVIDPNNSGPISQVFNAGLQTRGVELRYGDVLNGAFVEYNMFELQERRISEITHNFTWNTNIFTPAATNINGLGVKGFMQTDDVTGGYIYQPHYEVPIRAFSTYIEAGDPNEAINVPSYSTYFETEKTWKWRDIWDIGFIEEGVGVDYPFLNGSHYPMKDIKFFIKRRIRAQLYPNFSAITATIDNLTVDGCE